MTLETQTPASKFPLVVPTRSETPTARLILRNDLGQVIQQWLVRQNKCTLGSAASCALRCSIPGIAPYHALLVVGARQTFIRALAPKLTRDGVPVNEALLTAEQNFFEIAGHRFELTADVRQSDESVQEERQDRLKFTLARPLELNNAPASRAIGDREENSAGASPGRDVPLGQTSLDSSIASSDRLDSRWIAKLVQSAVEPLECQIQNVLLPIAQLQAEAQEQRALLEEQQARLAAESFIDAEQLQIQDEHERNKDELEEKLQQFAARQSAALDTLTERVSDVNQQLSAIEQIVSADPEPPIAPETAEEDTGNSEQVEAIHQLQDGMVNVSNALKELEERQAQSRADDQDWRTQIQEQVHTLKSSIDTLASQTEKSIESLAQRTEAGFAERAEQDQSEWRTEIQAQFAELRNSVNSAAALGLASLPANEPADFVNVPVETSGQTSEDATEDASAGETAESAGLDNVAADAEVSTYDDATSDIATPESEDVHEGADAFVTGEDAVATEEASQADDASDAQALEAGPVLGDAAEDTSHQAITEDFDSDSYASEDFETHAAFDIDASAIEPQSDQAVSNESADSENATTEAQLGDAELNDAQLGDSSTFSQQNVEESDQATLDSSIEFVTEDAVSQAASDEQSSAEVESAAWDAGEEASAAPEMFTDHESDSAEFAAIEPEEQNDAFVQRDQEELDSLQEPSVDAEPNESENLNSNLPEPSETDSEPPLTVSDFVPGSETVSAATFFQQNDDAAEGPWNLQQDQWSENEQDTRSEAEPSDTSPADEEVDNEPSAEGDFFGFGLDAPESESSVEDFDTSASIDAESTTEAPATSDEDEFVGLGLESEEIAAPDTVIDPENQISKVIDLASTDETLQSIEEGVAAAADDSFPTNLLPEASNEEGPTEEAALEDSSTENSTFEEDEQEFETGGYIGASEFVTEAESTEPEDATNSYQDTYEQPQDDSQAFETNGLESALPDQADQAAENTDSEPGHEEQEAPKSEALPSWWTEDESSLDDDASDSGFAEPENSAFTDTSIDDLAESSVDAKDAQLENAQIGFTDANDEPRDGYGAPDYLEPVTESDQALPAAEHFDTADDAVQQIAAETQQDFFHSMEPEANTVDSDATADSEVDFEDANPEGLSARSESEIRQALSSIQDESLPSIQDEALSTFQNAEQFKNAERLAEIEKANAGVNAGSSVDMQEGVESVEDEIGDGEESVEDYMNRLLNRMRGNPEPTEDTAANEPTKSETHSKIAELHKENLESMEGPDADPPPKTEKPFNPDEFVPRVSAPEQVQNLAAMRELANTTARSAIHKSSRERDVRGILFEFAVAFITFVVGGALLSVNGFALNVAFVTAMTCFAFAFIWGIRSLLRLGPVLQSNFVLQPNSDSESESESEEAQLDEQPDAAPIATDEQS